MLLRLPPYVQELRRHYTSRRERTCLALREDVAAVDDEGSANREARIRRGEEHDRVRDLLGACEPADRMRPGELVKAPLRARTARKRTTEERRVRASGADRVHTNTLGDELERHRPSEMHDGGLRRAIRCEAANGGDGELRGNVDDRTAAGVDQMRDRRPRERNTPLTLVSNTRSHSSSDISARSPTADVPAQ